MELQFVNERPDGLFDYKLVGTKEEGIKLAQVLDRLPGLIQQLESFPQMMEEAFNQKLKEVLCARPSSEGVEILPKEIKSKRKEEMERLIVEAITHHPDGLRYQDIHNVTNIKYSQVRDWLIGNRNRLVEFGITKIGDKYIVAVQTGTAKDLTV